MGCVRIVGYNIEIPSDFNGLKNIRLVKVDHVVWRMDSTTELAYLFLAYILHILLINELRFLSTSFHFV